MGAARANVEALVVQKEARGARASAEQAAWVAEGVELAADGESFLLEKLEKKQKAAQARVEYVAQIDAQRNMIGELAQLDAAFEQQDETKRLQFISAKAKMTKLQKAKMASIFDENQRQRSAMANKLAAAFRAQEDNTDALLAAAQAEKELEQFEREAAKVAKRAKEQSAIDEHRQKHAQVKKQAAERRRQMALAELDQMRQADDKFQQAQADKAVARRAALEGVTADNVKMINTAAVAERQHRDEQYHADMAQLEALKLEEDEFQACADVVIAAAEKRQRNTIPLKVVKARGAGGGKGPLNKYGIRPSYLASDCVGGQMPTYHNEISSHIKANLEPGAASESKQRIGFTW